MHISLLLYRQNISPCPPPPEIQQAREYEMWKKRERL